MQEEAKTKDHTILDQANMISSLTNKVCEFEEKVSLLVEKQQEKEAEVAQLQVQLEEGAAHVHTLRDTDRRLQESEAVLDGKNQVLVKSWPC